MEKFPIKLGRKMPGMSMPANVPHTDEEMFYPTLYLEWDKPYELPESGEMTIRFRSTRNAHDKKNGKFTEDLEVLEIVGVKAKKADKKSDYDESAESIDKLRDESESEE